MSKEYRRISDYDTVGSPNEDDLIPVVHDGENANITFGAIKTAAKPSKVELGLDQVDNTSDANKPISNAQATALASKADKSDTYTKSQSEALLNNTVKLDSNQTISGTKNFVGDLQMNGGTVFTRNDVVQFTFNDVFTSNTSVATHDNNRCSAILSCGVLYIDFRCVANSTWGDTNYAVGTFDWSAMGISSMMTSGTYVHITAAGDGGNNVAAMILGQDGRLRTVDSTLGRGANVTSGDEMCFSISFPVNLL